MIGQIYTAKSMLFNMLVCVYVSSAANRQVSREKIKKYKLNPINL